MRDWISFIVEVHKARTKIRYTKTKIRIKKEKDIVMQVYYCLLQKKKKEYYYDITQ